jgi:hypothetical protein
MRRTVDCTNNDVVILARQLNEFQEGAEQTGLRLPAQASYLIHRNETLVLQVFSKYEKKRQALVQSFIELDEKGKPKVQEVGEGEEKQMQVVFKDEKAFEAAFEQLLQQPVKIDFFMPKNVEEKIDQIVGEQKILNQMWYLLELFEKWDPANKVETEDESEQSN